MRSKRVGGKKLKDERMAEILRYIMQGNYGWGGWAFS